jgi:ribosomal protein S18 acetylase RimI-like enzyme
VSEFYSLRRNAITDLSAFFGFLIGFLGSSPIAWPYLQVGFQTQEIVKGFAWFIGITFGAGVLAGVLGLGVGRLLGWLWENSHKVVRRAKGHEFALAPAGVAPRVLDRPPPPAGSAEFSQPAIRYAQGVDAQQFSELLTRSSAEVADPARLRQAMMLTTNYGAWDNSRLVGALRVLSDGYEWTVVTDIIVDTAYRRRGIGRELMVRAASHAAGRFAVARIPPGTEGFFRRLDVLPAYDGFVRGAKSRLQ